MMSERHSGEAGNSSDGRDPWKYGFGVIGVLALSLLLLPPLPPWLRVIAIVIAGWAVLAGFNVLPRLHAGWQRVVSELPSDAMRKARWKHALGLVGLLGLAFVLLPPLPPRFRIVAFAVAVLAMLGSLGCFRKCAKFVSGGWPRSGSFRFVRAHRSIVHAIVIAMRSGDVFAHRNRSLIASFWFANPAPQSTARIVT
jgi:hypothetical protein